LAFDSSFEYDSAVHDYCGHRTNAVTFAFLTHLLRRATSLSHFATARCHCVFHQPHRVIAKRATRGKNFDVPFVCHSNSPPPFSPCALHSLAATLVERFARQFAEQFSVLLLFATACLDFFTRQRARHLRRSRERARDKET